MKAQFKIGDAVRMLSATLYGETEGTVYAVEGRFMELCKWALERGEEEFDEDGLCTLEGTIKSISVPYTFDGTYLKIYEDDEKTKLRRTSKFSGYSYSVKSAKMNTSYPETALVPRELSEQEQLTLLKDHLDIANGNMHEGQLTLQRIVLGGSPYKGEQRTTESLEYLTKGLNKQQKDKLKTALEQVVEARKAIAVILNA
jgi:hypothetical protein